MYLTEKKIKKYIKEAINEVRLFTPGGRHLDSKLLSRALSPEFIVQAFVDYFDQRYDEEKSRLSKLGVDNHDLTSDFAFTYAVQDIKEYLGNVLASKISRNDMSIVLSFEENDFEGEIIRNLIPRDKKFTFIREKDMSDIFKHKILGTHKIKDGDDNPNNDMSYTINIYDPGDKNIGDIMTVGREDIAISQDDYGKTKKFDEYKPDLDPLDYSDRTVVKSKKQPQPAVLDIYDDPEAHEPTELFPKR